VAAVPVGFTLGQDLTYSTVRILLAGDAKAGEQLLSITEEGPYSEARSSFTVKGIGTYAIKKRRWTSLFRYAVLIAYEEWTFGRTYR
jgi:hypothetical protein